jgi:serine/threonine protein phosphatase PrpC
MLKLNAVGKTDIGLKRSNNEDTYILRSDLGFFAVADGMGGAASGEIASRIFIDSAKKVFNQGSREPGLEMQSLIQESFRLGNDRILKHVLSNPRDKGMGCTAELIAFSGDSYLVGHVGDSRTYLFREEKLRQITKDHSIVQEQADMGLITPEEARKHALRNIVLRAVGINPAVALDLTRGKSLSNDVFLLCSDGLTDMVDDSLIQRVLSSSHSLNGKVEHLIESAISAGGYDNITVVLCEVLFA